MSGENYTNYYIETLTATMSDAIIRNVSLQAQTRVINEINENQVKQLEDANIVIERLKNELDASRNSTNEMSNMRLEYDTIKHQVQHLDTFRNELIKERELKLQEKESSLASRELFHREGDPSMQ